MGLVFQEHALFPHLTVRANVEFGVRDRSRSETAAKVDDMLELDPSEVRIGLPVEVFFERISEEITLPKFRPVAGVS